MIAGIGATRSILHFGLTTAISRDRYECPLRADHDAQVPHPLPWFLPSPLRIRGGLARHFASAWLFYRGIHFEASLVGRENKVTQLQRVGRIKLALKVDS